MHFKHILLGASPKGIFLGGSLPALYISRKPKWGILKHGLLSDSDVEATRNSRHESGSVWRYWGNAWQFKTTPLHIRALLVERPWHGMLGRRFGCYQSHAGRSWNPDLGYSMKKLSWRAKSHGQKSNIWNLPRLVLGATQGWVQDRETSNWVRGWGWETNSPGQGSSTSVAKM